MWEIAAAQVNVCDYCGCRYLLVSIQYGCEPSNKLWICDLNQLPTNSSDGSIDFSAYDRSHDSHKDLPFVKLIDTFDAAFSYVANEVRP